jgi:N12 class adenine-specific DNA methylase
VYFCTQCTVVPPVELQQLVFPFVEKSKIKMTTLIANGVYRPTAMGFINMLEHLRVVILQDAAEMLIAGRTHYLFLHEVFSCQLFKDFVKVMTIALGTVVEEEKSSEVFGEALDNKINKFHHTLDAGLKKMTSHIDSTKMTSRIQHKTVMQELSVLVTKRDIQKAMNAMLPAKKHKTGRGETSRIQPRTLYLHDHDISDTAKPTFSSW